MNGLKYLSKELLKIENNENSFMGMDGGNIESKTWFCGVEFAGSVEQMCNYYENNILFYEKEKLKIPYRIDCPSYYMNSFFDKSLTLMYLSIFKDLNFDDFEKDTIKNVLKNELYNKDSKSFKLNLFPVAKQNVGWYDEIEKKLGYDKNTYYEKLFSNRSNFIKYLVSKFEPNTIICFSPKDHSDYFIKAFIDKKQKTEYQWDTFKNEKGKEFNIKVFKTSKTKIIIIPFLGRGNLNSFKDVSLMTNFLKENYLV
jgi:hypothetical protein